MQEFVSHLRRLQINMNYECVLGLIKRINQPNHEVWMVVSKNQVEN